MFKRVDFYIIKKYLGTFFFTIALIIAISVVFDINERLDHFLKAPLRAIVVDYYLNFIPYFANMFSPLFAFIAVIFFTSKMADNCEIIALLSTGFSFKRLMVPYMLSATFIALFTFGLNAYIIPPSNSTRIDFMNKYFRNKEVAYGTKIQLMVEPGVIAFFSRFDNKNQVGYRFSLERFEENVLKSRMTAQSIKYNGEHSWTVRDYLIRNFSDMNEEIIKGEKVDTILAIEPSDFLISSYDAELMTSPNLRQHIAKQRTRGVANIQSFEIEYHKRFATAASVYILTAIGMCVSSRKVKGGMGLNIGIGLALSFSYILFSTISSTFAVTGAMSPFMAVWLPNFIYLFIAIGLYFRAPK